jgi:flagellar hook-basal body complex protein FliE
MTGEVQDKTKEGRRNSVRDVVDERDKAGVSFRDAVSYDA